MQNRFPALKEGVTGYFLNLLLLMSSGISKISNSVEGFKDRRRNKIQKPNDVITKYNTSVLPLCLNSDSNSNVHKFDNNSKMGICIDLH